MSTPANENLADKRKRMSLRTSAHAGVAAPRLNGMATTFCAPSPLLHGGGKVLFLWCSENPGDCHTSAAALVRNDTDKSPFAEAISPLLFPTPSCILISSIRENPANIFAFMIEIPTLKGDVHYDKRRKRKIHVSGGSYLLIPRTFGRIL